MDLRELGERPCPDTPDDCICLNCESMSTGFLRVMRWILAAAVGFIGGGLVLIIVLAFLADALKSAP